MAKSIMGMLLEIIDILNPSKLMVPKVQIMAMEAVKRGSKTPKIDRKLINKTVAINKKAMGSNVVKSFLIKSAIADTSIGEPE
jgi:hypothetical protein